jgi:acyl carrier protein
MTEQTIKQILADQFGVNVATINESSRLTEDLGADSLDMVEIVMEVEHRFGIEIGDDEYLHCTTVNLIKELVDKKLNKDK